VGKEKRKWTGKGVLKTSQQTKRKEIFLDQKGSRPPQGKFPSLPKRKTNASGREGNHRHRIGGKKGKATKRGGLKKGGVVRPEKDSHLAPGGGKHALGEIREEKRARFFNRFERGVFWGCLGKGSCDYREVNRGKKPSREARPNSPRLKKKKGRRKRKNQKKGGKLMFRKKAATRG